MANNLTDEQVEKLTILFKVLGDQTRTRIIHSIEDKELCVTDICESVNMNKSAVSHQLRILRDSKLVKSRRVGKEIYYSLDDEHVSIIFKYGLEHINEK